MISNPPVPLADFRHEFVLITPSWPCLAGQGNGQARRVVRNSPRAGPLVGPAEIRPGIGAAVAARIISRDAALPNKLHAGRFPMPPDQLAKAPRSSIIERQLEVGGNGGISLHDYLGAAKRDI
jgi:hypothetical protein